jgi:hypothetical protein
MRSASPATHPPSPWSPSTSSTAKGRRTVSPNCKRSLGGWPAGWLARWVAGPLGQTGRCLGHQPHRTWRLQQRPDRRSPLPGRYRNPGGGHRPGSTWCPAPFLKTRIQPPHPSAEPSTIRLPGLLTARCPGPVIAVRQRWHVQLRRRPGTSHQRDAAFLVDLGPLPAMGRIPPAALIGGPPVMPKLGQGCVLIPLCNR